MNENEVVNSKKGNGSLVAIVILLLVIIGLVGYIVYDKLNDNNEQTGITEKIKSESSTNTEKKESNDKESYKFETFNSSSLTYTFVKSGKSIIFDQARGNDINSGLEFSFEDNIYGHLDSNGYYNVVSIGIVENSDSVKLLALLKDNNENYVAYYSNALSEFMNMTSINYDDASGKIMNNFVKINNTSKIKSIGNATKNNINYPLVVLEDGNYILSTNGTLEKIN